MALRVQRERDVAIMRDQNTMLPVYMKGFLEKKSSTDKALKKCWTELRGNILFFYSTDRDIEYTEKIPLEKPLLIHMDSSLMRGMSSCKLKLKTSNTELRFKADTETMEMWKSYILAVTEYTIPRDMSLLPGQVQQLREVIEKEKERHGWSEAISAPMPPQLPEHRALVPDALHLPRASVSTAGTVSEPALPLYNDTLPFPSCYYEVSREEAEQMLQEHPDWGNLLLRPGSNRTDFAVSVWNGHPSFRTGAVLHYRVRVNGNLYIIELTTKVEVHSLHEVADHFVKATNGTLKPFHLPQPVINHYGIYTDTAPNDNSAEEGRNVPGSTLLSESSSTTPVMSAASTKEISPSTHPPILKKSSTSSGNSSTASSELEEELKTAILRRRQFIGEDMIYIESK